MRVNQIYKKQNIITGSTLWKDNVVFKVGDILSCDNKQWKIEKISKIIQGCFGTPINRYHSIIVSPIDHNALPKKYDELVIKK